MISASQEKTIKAQFGINPTWQCLSAATKSLYSPHNIEWWAGSLHESVRYPDEDIVDISQDTETDIEYLGPKKVLSENARDCHAPEGYIYLVFGPEPGASDNVMVMVALNEQE